MASPDLLLELSAVGVCHFWLHLYHEGWLGIYRPDNEPSRYSSSRTISPLPSCKVRLCLVALYFLVKCSEQVVQTYVIRPILVKNHSDQIFLRVFFERYAVHHCVRRQTTLSLHLRVVIHTICRYGICSTENVLCDGSSTFLRA
jgi:hypothetical protein